MTHRIARQWEAAVFLLLPLAALFYFSFRMDAALNRALPNVLPVDRADLETSILVYLPEVAMEPAFDEMQRFTRYPYPVSGKRRLNWNDRLTRQIAAAEQAQGLDPNLLSGAARPFGDLFKLKRSSLDQLGKAIDVALIGGYSGPRNPAFCGPKTRPEACVVRELFAQVYGDRTAREAM